jgi:tetratricopeptide (TPR) repeat protein
MKRNRYWVFWCIVFLSIMFLPAYQTDVNAAISSKSETSYYKEGLNYFKNKDYDLSIKSLLKALELKPDYVEAKQLLGWDYIKTGRILDAENMFLDVRKQKKDDIAVIQGLAWTYSIQGKVNESEKFFKDELAWVEKHFRNFNYNDYPTEDKKYIESIYSDGNYGLASLANTQGNYPLAVKYFEAALKYANQFTSRSEILMACGDVYYFQGKYGEAVPLYEKAVKEDKKSLTPQLKLAWSQYFNKKYTDAEKIFEKALTLSSKAESVESIYGIALCNYMQNKFDTAYNNFAKAIAVNPYYMDNNVVNGILEKKPEWKTLWKDFGLAYKGRYAYNYRLGNYPAALYKLDGYLLKVNPKDIEALIAEGWSYRWLGYLDKAIETFNDALKLNPKADEAYVGLGSAYLSYGKPTESLNALNQALSINPKSPTAYNGLAYYYFSQKNEAKAEEYARKAVSMKADYFDSQAFVANILLGQKHYNESIKEYEKLVQIDKSVFSSWNVLGWAYYNAGKYDEALNSFNESKKIYPFFVEANYGIGLALAKKGDMRGAKEALITAIQIYPYYSHTKDLLELIKANPEWADLYKTLGWSYYDNLQYQPALAAFKEYLAIKPGDMDATRGIAWSGYWIGQMDTAYSGFKEILNKKSNDTDALVGMGWVLYIRGKDDEALGYLEKAIRLDDKMINAWRTIGAIHFRNNRLNEANTVYAKIAAIEPRAVDSYNNQGWILYKEFKYNEAIAKFNESLKINPNLGEPYYGLALSNVKMGDMDKAKANFEKAMYLYPGYMDGKDLYDILDKNPKLKDLYNALGWSYYYQYSYDAAKSHFNKILKAEPDNKNALLGMGTIAYVLGDFKGALDYYNKVLPGISKTSPAWDKYSYMLDNLGWCYYYLKNYEKAYEAFKRLEDYHPEISYIAAINGQGWCELMKGDKADAEKLFLKSLKLVPYNYSAELGIKSVRD